MQEEYVEDLLRCDGGDIAKADLRAGRPYIIDCTDPDLEHFFVYLVDIMPSTGVVNDVIRELGVDIGISLLAFKQYPAACKPVEC